MTDGLSEAAKYRREYQEWDAPHCYVCLQKVEPDEMEDHIRRHSINEVISALVTWSVDTWKGEKKNAV